MRIFIVLLLFFSFLIYGKSKKDLDFYKNNGYPHFKFDCYSDIYKFIEKNKYQPLFRFEDEIFLEGTYCNDYWILKKNNEYFVLRSTTNYLKDIDDNINKKYLVVHNEYNKFFKKLSPENKYYNLKWWIYLKKVDKKSYDSVIYFLKTVIKKKTLSNICHTYLRVAHTEEGFKKFFENKIKNRNLIPFDGKVTLSKPINKSINFIISSKNYFYEEGCQEIKEVGEFVTYLFDGNKILYKNKLIYEKIERDNKKLNAEIAKYFKIGLIKFLNFYKKYVVKNGDK